MTPDGQIANPLDKAANREPFLVLAGGMSGMRTKLLLLEAFRRSALAMDRPKFFREKSCHGIIII